MNIVSLTFITLLIVTFIIYYIIPKKCQWVLLLCISIFFYIYVGFKYLFFILFTAITSYLLSVSIQKIHDTQREYLAENRELSREEKKLVKSKFQKKRKLRLLVFLFCNVGLLCFFKYFHFMIEQINLILSLWDKKIIDEYTIIAPLGVSFYTFQTIGYICDVYWGKITAEKNIFKMILFTMFFPQITQGPISNFQELSTELYREHFISYKNFSYGFQRLIWGFYKKMIIANTLSIYVKDVFDNYNNYCGITVLMGAFLYSVQIYADFSGYMDIMCGYCEMLDIKLAENFERPYFAKSIAEYWRRWHSTLGTWFKTYVYYPICMAKWNQNLSKALMKRGNVRVAQTVPATIALIVVWFATGFWHGASWSYIAWGGVNGLVIIISMWLDPVYTSWKKKFRINDTSKIWRVFLVIKTFFLVTLIKVLPEVGTLSDGFGLWKRIFTNYAIPRSFNELMPFITSAKNKVEGVNIVVLIGVVGMVVISLIQRKKKFRDLFNSINLIVRMIIMIALFFIILIWGVPSTWGSEGFMYANF